jgi:type IX secretion system PorP/SprF family membrane protein
MAQQDPVVSQYMFNGLLLNPAYAGSKEYFSTTLLHRTQWANWGPGAPQTQVFTFHARLKDQVNGVGLMVSNDHLGVTNQTDIYANYAYHIPMGDKHRLSLGLRGGFSYYRAELNKLVYWDQNDQIFTKGVVTDFVPNAGTGAYFYSRRFYAGVSVPHLLSYDPREMFHLGNDVTTIPHIRRHYLLTTGYAFEVSHNVVVKPSVLVRYVKNAPIQADFNCNVLLNNMLWVGASYRTGDSFVGMLELQATKRFRIGYAYDYTLTNIRNYSAGSHEIMLGYDFGYQVLKMKTPRYF